MRFEGLDGFLVNRPQDLLIQFTPPTQKKKKKSQAVKSAEQWTIGYPRFVK